MVKSHRELTKKHLYCSNYFGDADAPAHFKLIYPKSTHATMQAYCGAIPLLPGKKEAFKQFLKEAWVTRRKDWVKSDKRLGVTKDGWFLQKSTQGDWVLIYLEAKDMEKVFREIATSNDQFDVWMTWKIKEYTGVDFSQPPQGPPPTQLVSYGY